MDLTIYISGVVRLRAGDGGGADVPDHAAATRPPEGRHGQGGDVRLHGGQGGAQPHQAPGQQSLVEASRNFATVFTMFNANAAK